MYTGEDQGAYFAAMGNAAEAEAMASMNAAAEANIQAELSKLELFDNYLFHPSMLGQIMTGSKDKSDLLGETCKTALLACYIEKVYGRSKEIMNKYMEKGLQVEEDSLTLYSLCTKTFHAKNKEQFTNDFFIGTPDIIDGKIIIDIKSSWDIHTFHKVLVSPLNKAYFFQGQAYLDLLDADTFKLAYCLVNTPEVMINDAKRKLLWNMGVTTEDNEDYQEACKQLELEMTFDDIPREKRYIEFTIERDQKAIDQAHEKIKLCRNFLNRLTGVEQFERAVA